MFYSTYVSLNKYFEQIIIIFFTLEIYKSILSTALSTVYLIRTYYSKRFWEPAREYMILLS